ncbi:hypothetical protein MI170_05905 [Mycolicibacterium goodii]|uniref:hypothetical protein n=1 Tax=Mycolicibacterium goodii TaxID=134601 RepID=UPI001F03C9D6|nr:hypothetical protein [Mycolicibacterium goodii]ULN48907.1 hypothetical protein MI170_05905 [Mycolicibacterium goodii]
MSWLWELATLLTTPFLAVVVMLGAIVFRSRDWSAAFSEVGVWELERRGQDERKRSMSEDQAIRRILGDEPTVPSYSGTPFERLVLSAFAVLSGYGGTRDLAGFVTEKREALLAAALERQLHSVAQIFPTRRASYVWVAQKWLSRTSVAAQGIAWLLPRAFKEICEPVKKYRTELSVAAVFVGVLYWQLIRGQEETTMSAPDIVGLLVNLVLPVLVCGAIVLLGFRVLIAYAGPVSTWSTRTSSKVAVALSVSACLTAVAVWASRTLAPMAEQWWGRVELAEPISLRIGAGVAAVILAAIARNSVSTQALDRSRRTSDRFASASTAAMMLGIAVSAAELAIAGSVSIVRPVMFALIVAAIPLMMVSFGWGVHEWFGRYRGLTRGGVHVPRRGFSWRLIAAWLLSMAAVVVQTALPTAVQNSPLGLALLIPGLLAVLGLIPLLTTTVLYVRRVNRYYERHMTVPWPVGSSLA